MRPQSTQQNPIATKGAMTRNGAVVSRSRLRKNVVDVCIIGFASLFASISTAAPSIQGISGAYQHKAAVTVLGSGFGAKAVASPLIWDDASNGAVPSDNGRWSDCWPNRADSSDSFCRYTTPIRGVPLPHSNISRYIAAAHGTQGWTLTAGPFKTYAISTYPQPVFISYYMRVDDAWSFCSGDNNFKLGAHAAGTAPYAEPYWYYEHRNPDFTATSAPGIYTPYIPSSGGRTHTFQNGGASSLGKWVKIEVEALYTNQTNGYVRIWRDGLLGAQYTGATDPSGPGTKTDLIGGYARCYGSPTNWRYFSDIYFDLSHQRVVLANNANIANATIKEVQIPTSWSDNSVTVSLNLGRLTPGQTAYLFVFDNNGVSNVTGYPITVGSSSDTGQVPAENWTPNLRLIQ